jgi:hypothetical protein
VSGAVPESVLTRGLLVKDIRSDTRLYALDSSSLFSFKSGGVSMNLSFPSDIRKGVYSRCSRDAYFSDYLLFSVNPSRYYFIQPGMYAALTKEGIVLTFWTSSGKTSIVDTSTDCESGSMHLYEFCWDWSAKLLGGGVKAAIFVDGICTASSNIPISNDSMSALEFTALDNEWMDFQTDCVVADVMTYESVPMHLRNRIGSPSSYYFGTGYVALSGRSQTMLWTEPWTDPVVVSDRGALMDSRFSMSSCDTSGDMYIVSGRGVDGYGSVSMVGQHGPVVTSALTGTPSCVAVTQIDGVEYPRVYSDGVRRCPQVWVADGQDVVLYDHFLVEMARAPGFTSVSCIIPTSDGRAWILDKAAGRSFLLNEGDASILSYISVSSPDCGGVSADGKLYIYDSSYKRIRFYDGGVQVRSFLLDRDPLRVDVAPTTGEVFAFFTDGTVLKLDWNLRGETEWSVSPGCFAASVRRGDGRNSLVICDRMSMRMYETSYDGVVLRSCVLPPFFYSGGIAVPSANVGEYLLRATVPAAVSAGISVVSDLMTDQFNVDRMSVDVSGGGPNDAEGVGAGNDPTDLPPGVYKGTRLPE